MRFSARTFKNIYESWFTYSDKDAFRDQKVTIKTAVEIFEILKKCKLDKNLIEKNYKLYIYAHKFWRMHPPMSAWHNYFGLEEKCLFYALCSCISTIVYYWWGKVNRNNKLQI